jgi:hypothetical protein
MGGSWFTHVIPGLSSPAAADGPVPSSPGPVLAYSGPESFVQAFGSNAFVITGSTTSGSASSVAAFWSCPDFLWSCSGVF